MAKSSSKRRSLKRRFKPVRLLIVIVVFISFSAGIYFRHQYQVREQAGTYLVRAEEARQTEDWITAQKHYDSYLNLFPDDVNALVEYAQVLDELLKGDRGLLKKAISVHNQILKNDAERSAERYRLAQLYISANEYTFARTQLELLLNSTTDNIPDAELHDKLAICDAGQGAFAEAVEHLQQVIALSQAEPKTYLSLALILRDRLPGIESRQQADGVMNQLLAERPNDVDPRLAMAEYHERGNEPQQAWQQLSYAFNSIPEAQSNPEIAIRLAELASNPAERTLAGQAVEASLETEPKNQTLLIALANLQLKDESTDSAIDTLQRVAQLKKRPDNQLFVIGERLIDLKQYDDAETIADRFKTVGSAESNYLHGRIALAQGRWAEALPRLQQAIAGEFPELKTQKVNAYIALSECYRLALQPDKRAAAAKKALELNSDSIPAKLALAQSDAELGRTDAAMQIYLPMVESVPEARLQAAQLRYQSILEQPRSNRDWLSLDTLIGDPPYPVPLAMVATESYFARGEAERGTTALEQLVKSNPDAVSPRATLAAIKAARDPAAGLQEVEQAQKQLGDRVDLRLVKARILAQEKKPNIAAIEQLNANTGAFPSEERSRLAIGLGAILSSIGQYEAAIPLYQTAAMETPGSLSILLSLFDLATLTKNDTLQQSTLDTLVKLEGEKGPTVLVARVTKALTNTADPTPEQFALWQRQLEDAVTQRPNWDRAHGLLGELYERADRIVPALDAYRKAVQLGNRSPVLFRNLVGLLLRQGAEAEALTILATLQGSQTLPDDLQRQYVRLRSAYNQDPQANLRWAQSKESAESNDVQSQLIRAEIFLRNDNVDDARNALDQAVALDRDNPDVWLALIRFLVTQNNIKAAEEVLRRADEALVQPNADADRQALVSATLGQAEQLLGHSDAAAKQLRQAITADPDNLNYWNELQAVLLQQSNPKAVEELLQQAMQSKDNNVRAWGRRREAIHLVSNSDGYAHRDQAMALIDKNLAEKIDPLADQRAKAIVLSVDPFQREQAIETLLETAKRIPLTAYEQYLLGWLYHLQSNNAAAETALRDATNSIRMFNIDAYTLLIEVQLALGQSGQANATLNELKRFAPNSWPTLRSEAIILNQLGQTQDATQLLMRSPFGKSPAELNQRVGPLLETLKATAAAEAAYRKAYEADNSPTRHVALVRFLSHNNQAQEAADLAFQHHADTPIGTTAQLFAAIARSQPVTLIPSNEQASWQSIVERMDNWVKEQVEKSPNDPALLFARAAFEDLAGDYDSAIKLYERLLKLAPGNSSVLNNLAFLLALHRPGASAEALATINAAIQIQGPTPQLLDTRALAYLANGSFALAQQDLQIAQSIEPSAVYAAHLAFVERAEARLSDPRSEAGSLRFRNAQELGLTKDQLHPLEWPQYEAFAKTNAE